MKFLTDNLQQDEIDLLGKKAGNLVELAQYDMPIPNGFILSWNDKEKDSDLVGAIEKIGGFPVAVRSSGQLEDLGDMSFAGLYETFLYVNSLEDLKTSIQKCFDSTQSQRVKEYLENAGIKKTEAELYNSFSVLVQKMVDPDFAGVAFTINPLDGIEDHLLIEACEGVGESLVSGEVTPNQYTYHYFEEKIVESNIVSDSLSISDEILKTIASYSLEIQAIYGKPQDIEWAVDKNGKFWILQARPITAFNWRKDLGELTNADLKDGGISSAVCTPLMFSLYRKGMNESMPAYFKKLYLLPNITPDQWLFTCYGRAYWSSGFVKQMLKAIPGYDEKKFDEDLGIMKDYGERGPETTSVTLTSLLKAIPVLYGMDKEFKNCYESCLRFKERFEKVEKKYHQELKKITQLETKSVETLFFELINEVFLPTETSYYRTIYNNSNLQTMFKEYIEKLENKLGEKINIINLLTGLTGVAHLEIQEGLSQISVAISDHGENSLEVERALSSFLTHHFHHGDRELDLLVPRWGEMPERVIELAKSFREAPTNSSDVFIKENQRIIDIILGSSLVFKGMQTAKFQKKVGFMRNYLKMREKMREYSTRSYYLVRQFLLELDKRWQTEHHEFEKNDIFYFHIDEILSLIQNKSTFSELSKKREYRKLMYRGYSQFDAPNDFGFGRRQSELIVEESENQFVYRGIACSPGVVKGRAIVACNLDETKDIIDGDILITKFTDPGWTPILGRVSAVVTEVGGVLSHAAVISREYGIPAVLNVDSITKNIKSGMVITIDGDAGAIIVEKNQ